MQTPLPSKRVRILIAIDDSQPSEWALFVGGRLAAQLSAQVMLVHVIEPITATGVNFWTENPEEEVRRKKAKHLLARSISIFLPNMETETCLPVGLSADQIVAQARLWRADLIVIGAHGHSRVGQLLLGSTAGVVIGKSPCPVVSVAHKPHDMIETAVDRVDVTAATTGLMPSAPIPATPQYGTRDCDWFDGDSLGRLDAVRGP